MIKKIKITLSILLLIACLASCNNKPKENEVWIEGEITGESFPWIIIEELTPNGVQKIDSVAVINQKFNAKIKVDEIGFYFLRRSANNFISIVLEPGTIFKIKAPADSLGYPTEIVGSSENNKMLELNHKLDDCYRVTDSLSKIFKEYQYSEKFDSVKITIDTAYYQMFNAHKIWLETFIQNNPTSITTIVAFYQTIGRRSFFNAKEDFSVMESIDKNLQLKMPNNKHVAKFHALFLEQKIFEDQRLKSEIALEKGKILPNIELPNSKDELIDVSKIKAPRKLILFWNIQSLVDHSDRGLIKSALQGYKVIAISFEQQYELWQNYAPKEYPNFVHLIDLKGLQGFTAQTFNITNTNIPFYVIVDGENRIIASGKSLKELLKTK